MSLLASIFRAATPDVFNDPNYWTSSFWDGGRKTVAGENVNTENVKTVAAYFNGIRIIAEDTAKLPLITYRRVGRGKERAPDHPLFKLLRYQPSPFMGAMSYREAMTATCVGWGNAYSEIQTDNGRHPIALNYIHPSRVTVKVYPSGEPYYIIKNKDGSETELAHNEMFHLHGIGGDGYLGWSPLRMAAESLGVAIAGQKLAAAFYGNGANIQGVLEHPKILKKEAKDYLRQSWQEIHSGAANANKVAILEEGMKFSKISIPPSEGQFLEARKFQVEEIARWLRIPPHKLQHLERATFSNIEMQSIEHVNDCLMPWLVRWEEEIQRKLFSEDEREEYFAEHLVNALMRGDSTARGTFYNQMRVNGVMSTNDIRELENLNPIGPEGDEYFIQGAMVPLKIAMKGPQVPQAQKPIEPSVPPPQNDSGDTEKAQAKVFLDAATRWIRKECMAVARMAKKHGKNVSAFKDELGKFHAEQWEYFVSVFESLVIMDIPLMKIKSEASEYCRLLELQVDVAVQDGCLDQRLKEWESDLPRAIVANVMSKELK